MRIPGGGRAIGKGCPALNLGSAVTGDSERANALRAVLWIDKHNPDAFVASLELFT